MLTFLLTSLSEPIGGGLHKTEGCDLQSGLVSLQALCESLVVAVNSCTQTRAALMQHSSLPAALSESTEADTIGAMFKVRSGNGAK